LLKNKRLLEDHPNSRMPRGALPVVRGVKPAAIGR
jgi:hypothetical protein